MRKYYLLFVCVTVSLFSFVITISAQSEWLNPLNWSIQVNDEAQNPKIVHKLYVQGFDEDDKGILDYQVSGKHDFIIPNEYNIQGGSDTRAIRLFPGSKLVFDVVDFGEQAIATFKIPFAFVSPKVKEDIAFTSYSYVNSEPRTVRPCIIHKEDKTGYFNEIKTRGRKCCYNSPIINPSRLEISVGQTTGTSNGFYCIDSVFLFLEIPDYSLFNKSGYWHNNNLWSHLYPKKSRKALIDSDVIIDSPADCEQIINNQKDIKIVDAGRLKMKKMSSLYEFPEKGKWFFVSFPFDVYPEDLDTDFQMGDESTITDSKVNNVLYACKYDGKRRADTNKANGNWIVISTRDIVPGEVLFHKGAGYLLAIDQTADKQLLTFSSSLNTELIFTPDEILTIKADEMQTGNEENNGWILCGNPYTSSLSLKDIQSNSDLDGFIYVFDGENYKPYPIGSDWSIPAHCPFFVKAKRNTQLVIKNTITEKTNLLQNTKSFSGKLEPSTMVTSKEKIEAHNNFTYKIYSDHITLYSNVKGYYCIYDVLGRILDRKQLLSGENDYILPSRHGVYFVNVMIGRKNKCIKVVH